MIECVLTDSLFIATAIASAVIGCALGVGAMCLLAISKDSEARFLHNYQLSKDKTLIVCTKEDLEDPDFMERLYRHHNGA